MISNKQINITTIIFLIIFIYNKSNTIDNAHFYRANYFWGEPRFETPWLSSLDISIGGGKSNTARNAHGNKTSLLNIVGPQNMQALGLNVPQLDPTNPLDQILINLAALPKRDHFGQLQFMGTFSIIESIINIYQNLCYGFFIQFWLPIRQLSIHHIDFIDLSPAGTITPNKSSPEWLAFLDNMPAIFNRYHIIPTAQTTSGIGDTSFLIGWARNKLDTEFFDFIDVNAKFGILFPTGKQASINKPFELPLGYNGFWGLPLKFDLALGLFEWITLGGHIGALFLFKQKHHLRLKTSLEQQGFFTLTTGLTRYNPGTLWDICTYLKADHFCKGLSLLLGYSYNQKDVDCLEPLQKNLFSAEVVNHDQLFLGWIMHVLHIIIEYDFAQFHDDIGPRISFHYNRNLGGKRIFDTSIASGFIGIDVEWCF